MGVAGRVDLHLHTECSDGVIPVYAVIPAAERLGLLAFAKADHNNTAGTCFLMEQARNSSVECIPAVELDTAEGLHVLGYFIDPDNDRLLAFNKERIDYRKRLLALQLEMWKSRGGSLSANLDEVVSDAYAFRPQGQVALKHVCDFLVGYQCFANREEALADAAQYIDHAGLPSDTIPPAREAVRIILEAGGVAIYAHPSSPPMPDLEDSVEHVLSHGAVGVEALNAKVLTPENQRLWSKFCRERELVITGGTDWHGPVDLWNVTCRTVADYSSVEALKAAVFRVHGRLL